MADAVPGFFRCPSLNSDTIVFTAEGDLWKVAVSGGAALRLTSHAGEESMAALSMDGSKVAFSAYYEGTKETNEWGLWMGSVLESCNFLHKKSDSPYGTVPMAHILSATEIRI